MADYTIHALRSWYNDCEIVIIPPRLEFQAPFARRVCGNRKRCAIHVTMQNIMGYKPEVTPDFKGGNLC